MGSVVSKACVRGKRREKNVNVSQNGSNSKTPQQNPNPKNTTNRYFSGNTASRNHHSGSGQHFAKIFITFLDHYANRGDIERVLKRVIGEQDIWKNGVSIRQWWINEIVRNGICSKAIHAPRMLTDPELNEIYNAAGNARHTNYPLGYNENVRYLDFGS